MIRAARWLCTLVPLLFGGCFDSVGIGCPNGTTICLGGPDGEPRDGVLLRDLVTAEAALADAPPADLATTDLAQPDFAPPDFATPDLVRRDLAPVSPHDLGAADLAPPDLAPPDLAAPDLAAPDLETAAPPDLALPDLLAPDLFMPDLRMAPFTSAPFAVEVMNSTNPIGLAAARFFQQNQSDLAILYETSHEVRVVTNGGNGSRNLNPGNPIDVDLNPVTLRTTDLDSDGFPDLVMGIGNNVDCSFDVLYGDLNGGLSGRATWQAASGEKSLGIIAVPDPREMLAPGVAAQCATQVVLFNGGQTNRQLVRRAPTGPMSSAGLVVGNFGLNAQALAVANTSSLTFDVYEGQGNFNFTGSPTFSAMLDSAPTGLARARINADARDDLLAFLPSKSEVAVLLSASNGTFSAAPPLSVGGGVTDVVGADFNGDSITDLAVADSSGNIVRLFTGDGAGHFAPAGTLVVRTPQSLAAADFDGDGAIDLAVADFQHNTVYVFFN